MAMDEFLRARVLAKLDGMVARMNELTAMVADPEFHSRPERAASAQRELGGLHRVTGLYDQFRSTCDQIVEDQKIVEAGGDAELVELATLELPELRERAKELADSLIDELLAAEGDNQRHAIVEIRAGTGGDEAALWARDLRGMYERFADRQGWKIEPMSDAATDMGGFKETVFGVRGDGVFNLLKFESGGHRVQRVPATESQGRVHTSAATVAVLPEAEDVEVEINDSDLEIQAVRASGPGGQNVNKVSSAVRITHRPSGLMVFCQEERSQVKNKAKAMKLLRTRLFDRKRQEVDASRAAERKTQVGSGDRNMRVRTYNFPQNRVTDHRIGRNFTLEQVLEGKLDPILEALLSDERERRIEDL